MTDGLAEASGLPVAHRHVERPPMLHRGDPTDDDIRLQADSGRVTQRQVAIYRGDVMVLVTLAAPSRTFPRDRNALVRLLDTWRWT
jgi:hypothetical protein